MHGMKKCRFTNYSGETFAVYCGADTTGNTLQHGKDHALNDGTTGGYTTKQVEVQVGTETVHHEAVYEDKWIVDKEAWTETIHHEAVYEDKWIVDKEAWTETIHHEAVYEKECIL